MNQELIYETIPFEIEPEFEDEIFELEDERGGLRTFGGRASRSFRPNPRTAVRAKGNYRPQVSKTKPRPAIKGRRWPINIIHEPYFPKLEPYPAEPEPSGSENIRWVQDCLNQSMGLNLPVTGLMGPETRSAIRSFQRERGIRASGIMGPDTEQALQAACSNKSMELVSVDEYTEEPELGPLTATLRWLGPQENPTLFTREEASKQSGGGVYIVVESSDSTTINRILKVGKTVAFASRFGKDKTYRRPVGGVPAGNLRFYLANVVGFVDPYTNIEKAIARLLFRSGERLSGSRYVASTPVSGKTELRNILPKPFLDRLLRAYRASGKDSIGNPIPKGRAAYRIYPDTLVLEPASFPHWEVT